MKPTPADRPDIYAYPSGRISICPMVEREDGIRYVHHETHDELLRVAEMMAEALRRCYDVCEWPANGQTSQDKALAAFEGWKG